MLTAAAIWVLALLGPVQGWGLSPAAEDNTKEADYSLCSHSFYKQTPPKDASSGQLLLRPRCHRLPGGHDFATLHRPDCDKAVGSALHINQEWTKTSGQVVGELVEVEKDGVFMPALLRGGMDASSPKDSPLQCWDSTVSTLVHSTFSPQCWAVSGDLYILTGAKGCQTPPLWSAMCCSVPGGKSSFSVGLISATDNEGQRQVSMKELQEMLGVKEMFSGGCQGADVASEGVTQKLHTEEQTQNTRESTADSTEVHSEANEAEESENSSGEEKTAETHYDENATDQKDANSSSIVVSIFSTTLTILKAPLRPIFSRITQFPGQVTYVLQEDLGVLSALPGHIGSFFYLLTSDLLAWMHWALENLFGIGEWCVYGLYHCASSMLGELLNCCYAGVMGIGTLAGDTVGIFGEALNNIWRVIRFFGGCLLKRSGDCAGAVAMEMGHQAAAIGGGLGNLAWKSGSGVFSIFRSGGSIIFGVVNVVFGAVAEGFGQNKAPVHTDVQSESSE